MSQEDWTDLIVGARMTVDREFDDRLGESEFGRQEWGLVMTAVEFEIEDLEGEEPRLVGNTDKLSAVLPEMERVSQMNPMGESPDSGGGGGGIFGSVKDALGLGGGDDYAEKRAVAEELVDDYAERLQAQLEQTGQWEHVLAVARADAAADVDVDADATGADGGA